MGGAAPRFLFLLTTPLPPLLRRNLRLFSSSLSSHFIHRLSSSSSPTSPSPSLTPKLKPKASQHQQQQQQHLHTQPPSSPTTHPWPECSRFLSHISSVGYAATAPDNSFPATGELSQREVSACLAFARDRPNLLRLLSMRDIAVVVQHGTPFLFLDAEDSLRKMKSFVSSNGDITALDTDRANMVDLMKFLLSYASNPLATSESNSLYNRDVVESSFRNLFGELFKLSYNAPGPNSFDSVQNQMPGRFERTMPPGQKIEMKRGDWICPRCNFMNFARNTKCLDCEEARPKRQLTGGEWECPQCDFCNYGRNVTCLRCDCKRPGQISLGATNPVSHVGYGNGNNSDTSDVDARLAANEEKAQRWFNKVSQLDSNADINSVIADEDFPEILPLRKGVNRFVVSTRKTPLERRLGNAQYKRNMGDNDIPGIEETKSKDTLDDILGRSAGLPQFDQKNIVAEQNTSRYGPPSIASNASNFKDVKGSNSSTMPPFPFSSDALPQKSENLRADGRRNAPLGTNVGYVSPGGDNPPFNNNTTSENVIEDKEKEQAEKSERWFRKVVELHDAPDMTSAVSDEDFPDIMPMRIGENRFVVSKKKDRSLTSPAYKRRLAVEQSGNTNFVPFVPFPPDYFAKKDKPQEDGTESTVRSGVESSSISDDTSARPGQSPKPFDQSSNSNNQVGSIHGETSSRYSSQSFNHVPNFSGSSSPGSASENQKPNLRGSSSAGSVSDNQNVRAEWTGKSLDGSAVKPNLRGSSSAGSVSDNQNVRAEWTRKSLEGSAVKEPDPLDMSEEAKAERWFRRVAQIKDISELSQIPDEDFPSIMPMRKGVNRFVVSKRKTPLERRLTSQQYKRNLPIVNSDPVKRENEGS